MKKAYRYLLIVILLWGASPLLVAELSGTIPFYEITFAATGIAVLIFALAITLQRNWKQFGAYSKKDVGKMAFAGAAGIFPYTTLCYLAFSIAPLEVGEVNIINYLWPIWVMVFSTIFLGERVTWQKAAGILLGFFGVYLIITGGKLAASS